MFVLKLVRGITRRESQAQESGQRVQEVMQHGETTAEGKPEDVRAGHEQERHEVGREGGAGHGEKVKD